ncbi:MAG: transposase [Planctomycetota bacterium]|nr:MAG: transposase [Planctomycetota bacterium]
MSEYRRYFVPGGSYFFTVVTFGRQPILCGDTARALLRACIEGERIRRPFWLDAIVLLPDHLHAIWSLPGGDADYSSRWADIKAAFTQRWLRLGGNERSVTQPQRRDGRRGVWQRRFFEHTIRDEDDFQTHLDYIHFNPVKHGLAASAKEWPYSTFHRYVEMGVYDAAWGRGAGPKIDVDETLVE